MLPGPKPLVLSPEQIARYLARQISAAALARELGLHCTTVLKALHRQGVKTLSRKRHSLHRAVMRAWKNGATQTAIALHLGVSQARVQQVLKANGLGRHKRA